MKESQLFCLRIVLFCQFLWQCIKRSVNLPHKFHGITYTYSKSFKFLFYPKMISLILLNNKSERFDLEGSDNDVS